jgi:hypothetical protein
MEYEFVKDPSTMLMTGEDINEFEEVSNCCGANTSEPDIDGLARCSDCKEMCYVVPEHEIKEPEGTGMTIEEFLT